MVAGVYCRGVGYNFAQDWQVGNASRFTCFSIVDSASGACCGTEDSEGFFQLSNKMTCAGLQTACVHNISLTTFIERNMCMFLCFNPY